MADERYEVASQLAADIRAKAEELSTAIYQARRMGYETVVKVNHGKPLDSRRFLGTDIVVEATVDFHIGKALL